MMYSCFDIVNMLDYVSLCINKVIEIYQVDSGRPSDVTMFIH